VDGNDNPPLHEALSAVMADSKVASGVRGNSATLEIRMRRIQAAEFAGHSPSAPASDRTAATDHSSPVACEINKPLPYSPAFDRCFE
jgi:hypothetical protein